MNIPKIHVELSKDELDTLQRALAVAYVKEVKAGERAMKRGKSAAPMAMTAGEYVQLSKKLKALVKE